MRRDGSMRAAGCACGVCAENSLRLLKGKVVS